ncbi:glycerol-3-phosphate dehydrogenase [Alteriqipengyuania sp. NZ-12B]|uniref:Glycerol-3-phosphate dehydrogenase n=1 Tax=Alteriqipengyuania abyssalis TaxID=2860200 RepID=A0ABS7PJU6_9SPHN|nr:glycerol-3-phosphate dehydrogenase [Alteriqipengyuania abyssalis]MBY8338107.1 glycerol-3-phosphate dehydrogenase [Alteriqipengyuania abyssalis]
MSEPFDLLVIGGGINGAGIARDAAGRGLSVLLVEKDDLAAHTSSASTKLVHGGLRYLEYYEFRLVRESLQEREVLLRNAPHIIWPMRFVLPHHSGLRPAWLLRLGLFLYDHIGGRKLLPPTKSVNLREPPHASILKPFLQRGFEYSDCWVEDARLVVLNALDAKERGADIRTRTECTGLAREGDLWRATLNDGAGETQVSARMVANAAGPWVDQLLQRALHRNTPAHLRLVKGSHLIVPKLWDGAHCYIFQNGDGRICFAIPYERDFTLLGTTDEAFQGDPNEVTISEDEAAYICASVNEYLATQVHPEDAVSSYSGVRPLYEDAAASASEVTRDYVFEVDDEGGAPILSVFGGKITTFRKLAEHALEKLAVGGKPWTSNAPLPGGDFPDDIDDGDELAPDYAWAYETWGMATIYRFSRAYGTRLTQIIGTFGNEADTGPQIAPGVFETELRYLRDVEFARTGEDVLWRRSKLGLHLDEAGRDAIARWFDA